MAKRRDGNVPQTLTIRGNRVTDMSLGCMAVSGACHLYPVWLCFATNGYWQPTA